MKKFLLTIFLFIIPIFGLLMVEVLLPSAFFSFRTWEGISFNTKVPHRTFFYPNSITKKNATGDLCHHTKNAVRKYEFWITDTLGFRNNTFIGDADILFIGDSYIAGSSLSQNEIVSNKVKSKLNSNVSVYNMAPSSMSQFDYYFKKGIFKKPKLLIYSIAERNIPLPFVPMNESLYQAKISDLFSFCNINVYIDKAFRLSSIRWLKARIYNSKGYGIPGITASKMFFFQGANQKHEDGDLQKTVANIQAYKKYCDSLNVKFLFIPMPDKETVYYELVPFTKQADYLFQLDSLLKKEKISTINTLSVYNEYRKSNHNLLYHLDDTHWNSTGTELVSNEIIKFWNQNE